MTIQLYVNNQTLSLNPAQKEIKVVADSRNYLKVQFTFQSADWKKGGLIYALFTHNGQTYKKFLGIEENTKWNECYVAPEVIKEGKFSVSLFCDDLITTNIVEIPVQKSGYTENIVNQPATPTVLEQMNTLMYKYASLCNQMYEECRKMTNK